MRYTQHESIYREDVKLPLHIGNTYQQNSETTFKINFELLEVNKINFDTNWNQIVVDKIKVGTTCR